jgi:hypothetical protein
MAKTGILGTINSKLGQILLGTKTEVTNDLVPFAPDTLTITDTATTGGDIRLFATDTLTISDVATTGGPWVVVATDTLAITDEAPEPGGPFDVFATDNFQLSNPFTTESNTVVGGARDVSVNDGLSISDEAINEFENLTDALAFSDEATVAGGDVTVSAADSLSISETVVVVGGEQLATVSDNLVITEAIIDGGDARMFITSTLTITETVTGGGDVRKSADDTLSISELVQEIECVTDTLTITDEASDDDVLAEDTLTLTEEAIGVVEFNIDITDTLTLTDVYLDVWCWNTDASDALTMTQEEYVVGDPGFFQDVDVGLRELAEAGGNINVTIEDVLPLFEVPSGWNVPAAGAVETATDTLSFTESARASFLSRSTDYLGLTDEATAAISRPADDSLTFEDTASVVVDYNVDAVDTLTLDEFLMDVMSQDTCTYDESQAGAYPADTGLSFRLVGDGSWSVRAPTFGNKDVFSPQRIVSESRGGTLVITAQPEWPEVEVLKMNFSVLKKQEGLDLQDFLSVNLGKVITLTDWEGRAWTGVVTDTNTPLSELGTDNFSMGFEFEGTKV